MDSIKAKFADVGSFLDKVTDLPVLPDHINKISNLLSDDNTGAVEIAKAVAMDQGLAGRILKIANSVYYGRISQVLSLNEAVVVIGIANIKQMLYAIFMDQMAGDGRKETADLLKQIWKHSLAVAMLSSKIMEDIWPSDKESAYIAGLLHDVGELILLKYEPDVYLDMIKDIRSDTDLPRIMAEESFIGFTHADLGAELAKKWNLPREIRNTIFFHHNSADADTDKRIIECVRLADLLCAAQLCGGTDMGINKDAAKKLITGDMTDMLKLDEDRILGLFETAAAVIVSVETLMQGLKG